MSQSELTGNYVAVDTETTGLNCMQNEIIEVGAVRFRNWEPVAEFNTLIRPRCHIPYNITCLTGISDAMVAGKPRFAEIIDDLMSFIGDDDIVGHSVCFDLGFLSHGGAPVYTSGNQSVDTVRLARRLLKKGTDVENHSLGTMCRYYGIINENAHRACDDARAAGILYKCLMETAAQQKAGPQADS